MSALSITGIYDQRTLKYLASKGISFFGFDLRPRSLNFLQEYRLKEILENHSTGTIFLQFQDEKKFMIQKVLETIKDLHSGEIILQFYGSETLDFCDQFQMGYVKKVNSDSDMKAFGKYQKGLIFHADFLSGIYESGRLDRVLADYYRSLGSLSLNFLQMVEGNWNINLPPSLSDLLDIDLYQFSIDHHVEVCFRNVDMTQLEKNIKVLPNTLK